MLRLRFSIISTVFISHSCALFHKVACLTPLKLSNEINILHALQHFSKCFIIDAVRQYKINNTQMAVGRIVLSIVSRLMKLIYSALLFKDTDIADI